MRKKIIVSATAALLSALSIPPPSAKMKKEGMMQKGGMTPRAGMMKEGKK